jgi:putative hemolysin
MEKRPVKNKLVTDKDIEKLLQLKKFRLSSLAPIILGVLKLNRINQLYAAHVNKKGAQFSDEILKSLNIQYDHVESDLKNIPKTGPFIIVANHPYGGIDGLILISLISKVRPDIKILANHLLAQIHPVEHNLVEVSPFSKDQKGNRNIRGIKKALSCLAQQVPIAIFPAGEVSSLRLNTLKVSDKMWHPVAGKLILKAGVKVVPVYFSGHNSFTFNILGLIHPALRTARLPVELLNKKDEKIHVRIGKAVDVKTIGQFNDVHQLLRFLRAKTYALGSTLDVQPYFRLKDSQPQQIIEPVSHDLILRDIRKLGAINLLFQHQQFKVFISGAGSIPHVLQEIARLREITFREVGEGTLQSLDMDEYDLYYNHLFIWDEEHEKIVGAYRIGLGDALFHRYQKKGFYLNELFKIDEKFYPILKSSLELGRSFIVKEYQKKPLSLTLLWKGINEFLKRKENNYKYLIGPVSISNSFSPLSKDLLVDFITRHHSDKNFSSMIKPRKQFRYRHKGDGKELRELSPQDLLSLDKLISGIEISQMKIPVLLKKYLAQNARIIAFNIDPKFNNALDGFLVLNIADIPAETFDMLTKSGGKNETAKAIA